MPNILKKRIKLARIEHKLKTRLLGLKGAKAYILKRDGREKAFTQLASFDYFLPEFDHYRTSETMAFAVLPEDTFIENDVERSMRQVAEIATHIAVVKPDGESVVHAIRTGDEFQPYYNDATWKFFSVQTGDRYTPEV